MDRHETIVTGRCETFRYCHIGGIGMTSAELKHRAKLQEWSARIQDCRSSGLSVRARYHATLPERSATPAYWKRQSGHLPRVRYGTAKDAGRTSAPMLNDFTGADQVYIACGCTDLRKGIDGLARLVQQQFELDPFTNYLSGENGKAIENTGFLPCSAAEFCMRHGSTQACNPAKMVTASSVLIQAISGTGRRSSMA